MAPRAPQLNWKLLMATSFHHYLDLYEYPTPKYLLIRPLSERTYAMETTYFTENKIKHLSLQKTLLH